MVCWNGSILGNFHANIIGRIASSTCMQMKMGRTSSTIVLRCVSSAFCSPFTIHSGSTFRPVRTVIRFLVLLTPLKLTNIVYSWNRCGAHKPTCVSSFLWYFLDTSVHLPLQWLYVVFPLIMNKIYFRILWYESTFPNWSVSPGGECRGWYPCVRSCGRVAASHWRAGTPGRNLGVPGGQCVAVAWLYDGIAGW